jgi:2'-5' RNA ligase
MKLLVIAYPELTSHDFESIQNYRRGNDKLYYKTVNPHFTLVFPVDGFQPEDFRAEINEQISGTGIIPFVIRCATVSKDAFNDYYHTFLVPDEGLSKIVKLHDRLYSGKLYNHLRLDLDFIPHIGIGNSIDKIVCKKMTDEWNKKNFEIRGIINSADIVNYENETVTTIEKIKFNDI